MRACVRFRCCPSDRIIVERCLCLAQGHDLFLRRPSKGETHGTHPDGSCGSVQYVRSTACMNQRLCDQSMAEAVASRSRRPGVVLSRMGEGKRRVQMCAGISPGRDTRRVCAGSRLGGALEGVVVWSETKPKGRVCQCSPIHPTEAHYHLGTLQSGIDDCTVPNSICS